MRKGALIALALALALLAGIIGVNAARGAADIIIWHTYTGAQEAYLQSTAERFNAAQAEYRVRLQSMPAANFAGDAYSAAVNDVGPDMIFHFASEAARYADAGLAANLDEYIYDPEVGIPDFDALLPASLLAEINGFEDGHIHCLPGVTTGPVLYYNQTLLDALGLQPPETWDELTRVCERIKAARPDITPFGVESPVDFIQTLFLQAGHGYIDMQNRRVLFGGAAERVSWIAERAQAGLLTFTAPSGGYFANDFNAGLLAMYYGSCAGVPYIDPDGFAFAVAPVPRTAGGQDADIVWNRGPIVLRYPNASDGEARALGAYLFAKFLLTTPEVSAGWAQAMEALSPWENARETPGYAAYVAARPALKAVEAGAKSGVGFPSVTGAAAVRSALAELAALAAGGADVRRALEDCVAACDRALQGG